MFPSEVAVAFVAVGDLALSDDEEAARSTFLPRHTYDLLGHEGAEAVIAEAAKSGQMAHAWLLGGPKGVGKATLAFRVARYLLTGAAEQEPGLFGEAVGGDEGLACDTSRPAVRRIASLGHSDLLVLDRPFLNANGSETQDLNIHQIRRVEPFLRLKPAEGGWRIVIIDDAHAMNRNAENGLLKILEEPPDRTVMMLISERPGALLPTTRSRCRSLSLAPLDEAGVVDILSRPLPLHDPPESPSAAESVALARLAEGSPGRALDLWRSGGLERYRELMQVLAELPCLDWAASQKFIDKASGKGEGGFALTASLLEWWLSRVVRSLGRNRLPAEVEAGEEAMLRRLIDNGATLDHWLGVWDKARDLIKRNDAANLDPKQSLIQLLALIDPAA